MLDMDKPMCLRYPFLSGLPGLTDVKRLPEGVQGAK